MSETLPIVECAGVFIFNDFGQIALARCEHTPDEEKWVRGNNEV